MLTSPARGRNFPAVAAGSWAWLPNTKSKCVANSFIIISSSQPSITHFRPLWGRASSWLILHLAANAQWRKTRERRHERRQTVFKILWAASDWFDFDVFLSTSSSKMFLSNQQQKCVVKAEDSRRGSYANQWKWWSLLIRVRFKS